MVLFELIFDKSFQDTRLTNTYNKDESSDDTELLDMKNTIKFLNDKCYIPVSPIIMILNRAS